MAKNQVKRCSCGADIRFAFTVDFKVGNSGQDVNKLFPESPKVSEGILPLDIYICPGCGKVELHAGKEIKNALLRVAGKRK